MPFNRKNILFVQRYNHKRYTSFPKLDDLKIIGYWSVDGQRKLHWDSSQLRYYAPFKEAAVEYDLKKGSSGFVRKPNSLGDDKYESILRWIQRNYKMILDNSDRDKWLQPDFVFYRGILGTIIRAPYNREYPWIIHAAKLKGTIYLCQFDTVEQKLWSPLDKGNKWRAWSAKFEQYMTTENPGEIPETSKPVNESEHFCCVFQSRLKNHHLLYGANVNGLCSDKKLEDPLPLDKLKFVDFKTWLPNQTSSQETVWKKTISFRWWAKNYTIGIEDVVCGLRTEDDGVVRRLEEVKVSSLSGEFESKEYWNIGVCMNFAKDFFSLVESTVKNEYDTTIYKFERKFQDNIFVTELPPASEHAFLPDWYIELSNKSTRFPE